MSLYNGVLREVKLPPIENIARTLDSTIVCTVCRGRGLIYIKDPLSKMADLHHCPNCSGAREMKGQTTEEKEQLEREIRDQNVQK